MTDSRYTVCLASGRARLEQPIVLPSGSSTYADQAMPEIGSVP